MNQNKLLIITDAWHPQVNGVVTALEKMKDLLELDGFEVRIIHPGLFRTIPLPTYPEIRLALMPKSLIRSTISSFSPDYIHIATEGPLGFAARNICKKMRIPFSTSYHTHLPHYVHVRLGFLLNPIYAYMRWFHSASAVRMTATPTLKNHLEGRGIPTFELWPLGVDTQLFQRSNNVPPELAHITKPVFVYFGRLAVEKNVEEFLQCELPGTKIVIGDGPQRKQFEKKYPNVIFAGYKKGQELVDWISQGDVFVFPSRTETFGLVNIEALACGLPVAAHDVMGPRDIITHGVDGYLDEDLQKAALLCLSLSKEQCRQKALNFSWEASAKAFKDLLIKISY